MASLTSMSKELEQSRAENTEQAQQLADANSQIATLQEQLRILQKEVCVCVCVCKHACLVFMDATAQIAALHGQMRHTAEEGA